MILKQTHKLINIFSFYLSVSHDSTVKPIFPEVPLQSSRISHILLIFYSKMAFPSWYPAMTCSFSKEGLININICTAQPPELFQSILHSVNVCPLHSPCEHNAQFEWAFFTWVRGTHYLHWDSLTAEAGERWRENIKKEMTRSLML